MASNPHVVQHALGRHPWTAVTPCLPSVRQRTAGEPDALYHLMSRTQAPITA